MTRAQTKPDTARPEAATAPLTQQDYGTSAELQWLAHLVGSGQYRVTATRKVDTDSRYVVEFEAIKVGTATPDHWPTPPTT